MQLHYLWIREFKTIKEAGINLSSKFLFTLKESDGSYLLTISYNTDFISGFFKEKNITDVCAIIGKNGTGKSSVLNYIKENLPNGKNSTVQHDIIVYSRDDQYFISYPEKIAFTVNNDTEYDFKLEKYNSISFDTHLNFTEYIYYNYHLDYNEDYINYSGLYNISTTSLLLKERTRILQEIQSVEFKKEMLTGTSDLQNLHTLEVYQSVVFINRTEEKLPFSKPKSLHMMLDFRDQQYFFNEKDKYPEVIKILNKLDKIKIVNGNIEQNFISNLYYSIFVNYLTTERKYSASNPYHHKTTFKKEDTRDSYIKRFFSTMEGASFKATAYGAMHDVGIPKLDGLSRQIPDFAAFALDLIEKKIIEVKNEKEAFFKMENASDLEFKKFQNLYTIIRGITGFIQFRWHSLSSGEQSYLSLMSRFYSLVHEESVHFKGNLVILIDEGDTGYHPEWQRKFFKNTIKFLSSLFKDRKVQLIFTSNAPFLTSDLPKSNILFLEKLENDTVSFLAKRNSNENTFAANIHTLFSNSFYMEGMLIGEYAKDKINEIIGFLNKPDVKDADPVYKKIIESIGEPVLRKILQDMWFEKFGLQDKLEILKRQVAEIEEQIKKNNDTNTF